MKSLSLEPQATLDLDNRSGPVFIYISGGLTFRGAISQRDAAPNVLFGVFGSSTVNIEASFKATLVAPNAQVLLASVSQGHAGSFFARALEVMPGTVVTFRPFVRPDCDQAKGCLGGSENCHSTRTASEPVVSLAAAPRQGYVPVVSSSLDALFIVGGRNPVTQVEYGDVVVRRFDTGRTFTLNLSGVRLGKVLAATVSYLDGSLWVLDETAGVARVLRIDPLALRVRSVWQGSRQAHTDGQWLSLDRSGDVLLSSSSLAGQFNVLRIHSLPFTHGTETFERVISASGTLLAAPLVEDDGLTYLTEGAGNTLVRQHPPSSVATPVASPAAWL